MSAKDALVSVVIVCRDGAVLPASLDSALAQTFPSLEIIVVGAFPEVDSQGYPATVHFYAGLDQSAAANRAVGRYLCFLDEGRLLPATYIETCVFLAECGGFCPLKPVPVRPLSPDLTLSIPIVRKTAFLKFGAEVAAKPSRTITTLVGAADADREPFMYGNLIAPRAPHQPTILIAMPYLTMGGAEAIVSQHCRQLKALGYRLLVITTHPVGDNQGDTTAWFEESAAGVYHLVRFLDVSLWPAFICYLIQQHSVDAIWQVGSIFLADLLPQIRQLFPKIAVVDQLFNPVGHTTNYLKHRDLIDHVITEHVGMKDWLLAHGETEDRISVVPGGVNLEWYRPHPQLDWRTRQLRSPDDGKFVVGFIGRLSQEKGPDVFLDIAARLADRPNIEFLLCGGGPMEAQLRTRIDRDLSTRAHFQGFVSTREYLPCFDVTVVCSRLDGRPNLVMESLASGIPVIASRVGGIPEIIPEGRAGALCKSGDVEAFARAIRELADNRDLHCRYRAAARSHAEHHFSIAESGKRYAGIFEAARQHRAALTQHISPPSAVSLVLPPIPHPARKPRILVAFRILSMLLSPGRLKMNYKNARLYWRLGRGALDQARSRVADHFDARFYLRMYPDVTASGIPPLLHYVFRGFQEGRDPSQRFNSTGYMALHPDVAESGVNPLLHYLECSQDQYPLH